MSRTTVIMYWGRFDPVVHVDPVTWRASNANLSAISDLSFRSHLRLGHRVLLFSHQRVIVPDGVEVVDAGVYLDLDVAWSALERGCKIAYVSDLVRFRAGMELPDAVLMDMDQVVLNELPADPCFISSIPIRHTGILALKRRRDYKLTSRDGSWDGDALCDFPVRVGSAVSRVAELASQVEQVLTRSNGNFKDCGVIMRGMRTLQEELSCNAHPPIKFSPSPPWAGRNRCYTLQSPTKFDARTERFGYRFPSVAEIMRESCTVSHWFESSINNSRLNGSDFWDRVPDGCLLDFECRHVLGRGWRKELYSQGYNRRGFGITSEV